jgi:hypothetical protein
MGDVIRISLLFTGYVRYGLNMNIADWQYDLSAGVFTNHLKDFHDEWNLPLWVTEYAVQNFSYVPDGFANGTTQASYTDIQIFMDVTRSFMESVDWVIRYMYFGAMYVHERVK